MVDNNWGPLPEAEYDGTTRAGKFLDVEIIGTVYVGGDATIVGEVAATDGTLGDMTVTGTLSADGGSLLLENEAIFATAAAAPRFIIDTDVHGVTDWAFETGLTHEYAVGSLNGIATTTPEAAGLYLEAPSLGDATNRGAASFGAITNYTATQARAYVSAGSSGTYECEAALGALALGTGDAKVDISAVSASGTAQIQLTAADGIVLSVGTMFVPPSWTAASLQNSWVDFGGSYGTTRYRKDASGVVHIQGMIKNGTTTATTLLFALPAGYRPDVQLMIPAYAQSGAAAFYIDTSGGVRIQAGFSATWTTISCSFAT